MDHSNASVVLDGQVNYAILILTTVHQIQLFMALVTIQGQLTALTEI